jgi:hypothetical protein
MKDAGRYIKVTTVTTRTVALSSTVSWVRDRMLWEIFWVVDWERRESATESWTGLLVD